MIRIYAAGVRGEAVVREALRVAPDEISAVILGRDPGSTDDRRRAIADLTAGHNRIACCFEGEPSPEPGDWRILAGWRRMVEPTERTIVLHDSLLPRYRGFLPVVTALIQGEIELGATAFFASERYDEGDIIAQRSTPIVYPMTIARAFDIVAEMYASLAVEIVGGILACNLRRTPQNHKEATYSPWRDVNDYSLDWRQGAAKLARTVDALGPPYAGARAWARLPGGITRGAIVRRASEVPDVRFETRRPVGKVVFKDAGRLVVVCGDGLLRLEEIEWDGGDAPENFRIRFLLPEEWRL